MNTIIANYKFISILETFNGNNASEVVYNLQKECPNVVCPYDFARLAMFVYMRHDRKKRTFHIFEYIRPHALHHGYRLILVNAIIRNRLSFKEFQKRMNYNVIHPEFIIHDDTKCVWVYKYVGKWGDMSGLSVVYSKKTENYNVVCATTVDIVNVQ